MFVAAWACVGGAVLNDDRVDAARSVGLVDLRLRLRLPGSCFTCSSNLLAGPIISLTPASAASRRAQPSASLINP